MMVRTSKRCVVPGCPFAVKNSLPPEDQPKYHVFPDAKTPKYLEWVKAVGLTVGDLNRLPAWKRRVCSEHFTQDCYRQHLIMDQFKKRGLLRPNAVPNLKIQTSVVADERELRKRERERKKLCEELLKGKELPPMKIVKYGKSLLMASELERKMVEKAEKVKLWEKEQKLEEELKADKLLQEQVIYKTIKVTVNDARDLLSDDEEMSSDDETYAIITEFIDENEHRGNTSELPVDGNNTGIIVSSTHIDDNNRLNTCSPPSSPIPPSSIQTAFPIPQSSQFVPADAADVSSCSSNSEDVAAAAAISNLDEPAVTTTLDRGDLSEKTMAGSLFNTRSIQNRSSNHNYSNYSFHNATNQRFNSSKFSNNRFSSSNLRRTWNMNKRKRTNVSSNRNNSASNSTNYDAINCIFNNFPTIKPKTQQSTVSCQTDLSYPPGVHLLVTALVPIIPVCLNGGATVEGDCSNPAGPTFVPQNTLLPYAAPAPQATVVYPQLTPDAQQQPQLVTDRTQDVTNEVNES